MPWRQTPPSNWSPWTSVLPPMLSAKLSAKPPRKTCSTPFSAPFASENRNPCAIFLTNMAKSTNDKRLESVQKSITLHRRQLNTLLFRIEDLEAAMDDAK